MGLSGGMEREHKKEVCDKKSTAALHSLCFSQLCLKPSLSELVFSICKLVL